MGNWVDDAKRVFASSHVEPCPRCGGTPKPLGDFTCGWETYWVYCADCGFKVDRNIPSMRGAIDAWNSMERK